MKVEATPPMIHMIGNILFKECDSNSVYLVPSYSAAEHKSCVLGPSTGRTLTTELAAGDAPGG